MAEAPEATGAGARFVINIIGAIGLLFGMLPILRYVLELDFFEFATAPYTWLRLEGAARYLPPALVLALCIAAAYVLEKRLARRT